MKPTLDITVILSVYNYAQYLPEALDSVLAQTQLPARVILIDDASTDNSFAILEEYAKKNSIFEVQRSTINQGVNAVYNCCLKQVATEYVFFMAADDIILPELFSEAVAMLDAYPDAAFYSALSYVINKEGKYVRPGYTPYFPSRANYLTKQECHKIFLRYGSWIHGGTRVLRVNTLQQDNYSFDSTLRSYSDLFLAINLALTHGACYSPKFRSLIRIHGDSYSSSIMFSLNALNSLKNTVINAFCSKGILTKKELVVWQRRFVITSLISLISSRVKYTRQELIDFIPQDYKLVRMLVNFFYPLLSPRIKFLNAAVLYLSINPLDFFRRVKGALRLRVYSYLIGWKSSL